jgi:hypothetical protein
MTITLIARQGVACCFIYMRQSVRLFGRIGRTGVTGVAL